MKTDNKMIITWRNNNQIANYKHSW